jgi:hypothetical protein
MSVEVIFSTYRKALLDGSDGVLNISHGPTEANAIGVAQEMVLKDLVGVLTAAVSA